MRVPRPRRPPTGPPPLGRGALAYAAHEPALQRSSHSSLRASAQSPPVSVLGHHNHVHDMSPHRRPGPTQVL